MNAVTQTQDDTAARREPTLLPPVDVIEDSTGISLYADLPGVPRDKLNLRVEGDQLTIEVTLERGVLSISGERKAEAPNWDAKASVHINERFAGRFHRVVTLSDDLDPNSVAARYRDGVLHVTIQRSAQAQPRRVEIS